MPDAAAEQSRTFMLWFFAFLAIVMVCLEFGRAVQTFSEPVGSDPSNPAIKQSAFLVPLCWLAAVPLAFAKPSDVRGSSRWVRIGIRFPWAYACALCLLHIATAFHLGHAWSHEAAWEHTRQAGGYGDGIFVNYAFALVWLADALWLCVAFDSYFARPRWLTWAIHGFLAFVVFNAAVVFAGWGSRGRFVGCALLAAWLTRAYHTHERREQVRGGRTTFK